MDNFWTSYVRLIYVRISGVVTIHKFNNNNNKSSQYPSKSNCFPCTIYFHWNIFCVWSFCHFHKFLWKETASKANTTVLRSADDYSEHKRVKANLNKFFLKWPHDDKYIDSIFIVNDYVSRTSTDAYPPNLLLFQTYLRWNNELFALMKILGVMRCQHYLAIVFFYKQGSRCTGPLSLHQMSQLNLTFFRELKARVTGEPFTRECLKKMSFSLQSGGLQRLESTMHIFQESSQNS